jgi:HD-GYP domain-containing protein (c-di-GMP phosphodiesterase class II)
MLAESEIPEWVLGGMGVAGIMMAVKDLTPGAVLADAVISMSGKTLLGKDVELTPRHISLLNTWDIQKVFVSKAGGIREEEAAPQASLAFQSVDSEGYCRFVQEYDSLVTDIAQRFDFIRRHGIIPLPPLKETAGTICSSITDNCLAVINYLLISDHKLADYISRHSVMVAFFAGIIARRLQWSESDIKGVALAGLLHEVGNLAAGKAEDPRVKIHIAEAAALLRGVTGLTNDVILGVVQHRECMDGSGFPTGVNGLKIHPFAKVIAVANTFHLRAYTDEYANPFPVLEMLAHEMYGKLDTAVCHTFISEVKDSLLNNRVVLADGREAEIIFFHPNGSCLPVARTADGQIIDLAQRGLSSVSRLALPN